MRTSSIVINAARSNGQNVGIENVIVSQYDYNNYYYDDNDSLHYEQIQNGKIDMESWYSAIKEDVEAWMSNSENSAWMTDNNLTSTADIFAVDTSSSVNSDKVSSLISVYENHDASGYLM